MAQNYLSMCMNQRQLKINSLNLKIGKKIYLVNIVWICHLATWQWSLEIGH